jgi:hypothetical protein
MHGAIGNLQSRTEIPVSKSEVSTESKSVKTLNENSL